MPVIGGRVPRPQLRERLRQAPDVKALFHSHQETTMATTATRPNKSRRSPTERLVALLTATQRLLQAADDVRQANDAVLDNVESRSESEVSSND